MDEEFLVRNGFEPQLIVDEAPLWLRDNFMSVVARNYIHEVGSFANRVLWINDLFVRFVNRNRQSMAAEKPSMSALTKRLQGVDWPYFFDLVELISKLLAGVDAINALQKPESLELSRQLLYELDTNNFFADARVGWRFAEDGKLTRTRSRDTMRSQRELQEDTGLRIGVKEALTRASDCLDRTPPDFANAIKESVGAVEAYLRGRTAAPTLGQALKAFQRQAELPPKLVASLEKLYAFACDEPGIRHGSPEPLRVERLQAEFVYEFATATVRFIRGLEK